MKKRLLILSDHYLPGYRAGGPVRSISSLVEALKDHFEITVATRNHDFGDDHAYEGIDPNTLIQREGYRCIYFSESNKLKKIRKFLAEFDFDVVYLNSFFSAYFSILPLIVLRCGASKNSQIVIAPRGELSQGALSLKALKKNLYLWAFRLFLNQKTTVWHATSEPEKLDIQHQLGRKAMVEVLPNISNARSISKQNRPKLQGRLRVVFFIENCQEKES